MIGINCPRMPDGGTVLLIAKTKRVKVVRCRGGITVVIERAPQSLSSIWCIAWQPDGAAKIVEEMTTQQAIDTDYLMRGLTPPNRKWFGLEKS